MTAPFAPHGEYATALFLVERTVGCMLEGLSRIERDVNKRPRRDIRYTRHEIDGLREDVRSLVGLQAWAATATVDADRDDLELLREGLRQVAEGDYPADAGNAETWAQEILDRPASVNWANEP